MKRIIFIIVALVIMSTIAFAHDFDRDSNLDLKEYTGSVEIKWPSVILITEDSERPLYFSMMNYHSNLELENGDKITVKAYENGDILIVSSIVKDGKEYDLDHRDDHHGVFFNRNRNKRRSSYCM